MALDVNLISESERGAQAERLLSDPLYVEAVTIVRQAIIERWSASPIADLTGQHELRLMLKALDDVEGNIKRVVVTGKMANQQIAEEQEKTSRMQKIIKFGRGIF